MPIHFTAADLDSGSNVVVVSTVDKASEIIALKSE
jgi:hypothetical protein